MPAATLLLGLVLRPLVAHAEAPIRVIRNEGDYRFAQSLSFELTAESDAIIDDVVLRFTIGSDLPRNRRIPVFRPGKRVEARQEDTLARGQIPAAATITWWWTIVDDEGRTTETPRRTMVYLDERFDWQSLDSGNVRLWWYERERAFAEDLAAKAQQVLARLADILGSAPGRPIQLVVYQRQADMRAALVDRGEVYEGRLATLGARIAPDTLVLLAGAESREVDEILAHELSHIVLHMRFAADYVSAPLWLDEGLAMYSEGQLDAREERVLQAAVDNNALMSVRSLTTFPGDADLVPLAYAQSRDLIAYLIERQGRSAFLRFVGELGSGAATTDEALRRVYGFDQLALYQAYREFKGLPPAATPDAAQARAWRSRRRQPDAAPVGTSPCASALLIVPALLLSWGHMRARQTGN